MVAIKAVAHFSIPVSDIATSTRFCCSRTPKSTRRRPAALISLVEPEWQGGTKLG